MTLRPLRRGQTVLLDCDVTYAGRPLRGLRGTVISLSPAAGTVLVCTCASSSAFHASNCPADMPLHRGDVVQAEVGSPS